MKNSIYYLAGFMGAGKSTIGPILANSIGWNFYDLDKEIELKFDKKVAQIFSDEGEKFFRQEENEILRKLSGGERLIVALGGGTLLNEENLKIIKATGKVIYLKASVESFVKRLQYKMDRPVLTSPVGDALSKEELEEKINLLFNARKEIYEKADIIVDTDNIPIGRTIDTLIKILSREI